MLKTERLKCTFFSFQLRNVWFQHDGAPAQNIISEAVPGGGIRGTNNRVWWFPRVASTFTCPDSNGFLPVRIPQTAGVCDPSANIAGP
ncbi:hypothetical protein AVEN_118104-1 [Araneus ventricosus]|uniref:Uncharacterized protein n=1 Tax=Araneus ventricosus TaxID=182803 RepID=A0A4Y2VAL2_ARAVE|nr:hypothetical protein AVEN_44597-1 [Araneus ventricosus]GBO09138.1 hypothetical protein AVEN_236101-1 [Araneus ventricosus]GBO21552.1 hypothetical protein AVEN_44351-1 [Araneus ventricosus]GBO21581.1 hypothetical protein AVEN_118104-1 [Araneus ventricosus]